ncbi:MAG: hypothetical protein WBC65_07610 [Ignavibacteria bacterium]
MENTKLIILIKSLDQYEIRQFKDFINSPAFNKKKILPKLFDELKKYYPDFNDLRSNEKQLYSRLYPGETFDYFKLKNALSDLYNLGKEFLSFLKYKKDLQIKEKYLLEELRLRRLYKLFEQELKSAIAGTEKNPTQDEHYVQHKLNLAYENMSHLVLLKPNDNIHMQQEMYEFLLTYSLIRILKSYNVMLHETKQNNCSYDMHMFEEIMQFLDKKKFDNPTLIVYYHIINLERNKNDVNFNLLKKTAGKHNERLNDYDRYIVFLHLTSYCTNEYNIKCRTDLMNEHFQLIKEKDGWKNIPGNKILYPDFLNEVKIAVRANEIEWAEKYIEKNKYILVEGRDNTLNFCDGLIEHKKGNHDKALELLSRTNFPNFILKLQVKILELQILYEMEYFEKAVSAIDNFRHYIKREKTIKDDFKKMFIEFLNITGSMLKLKSGSFGKEKNYYKDKIRFDISKMTGNQFGIKLWLMENNKSL